MNEFNNEEIRVLESKDKLRRLQTRLGGRLRLVGSQKLVKFQHHIREGALTKVHGKGRRCAPCHLALLTEELVYSRPKDNRCAPSHLPTQDCRCWTKHPHEPSSAVANGLGHSSAPLSPLRLLNLFRALLLLPEAWLAAGRMVR